MINSPQWVIGLVNVDGIVVVVVPWYAARDRVFWAVQSCFRVLGPKLALVSVSMIYIAVLRSSAQKNTRLELLYWTSFLDTEGMAV